MNMPSQHSADAASALTEIQRRQRQVIDAVTIPVWYWWSVAAAMILIGAAVDDRHPVVLGAAIPVAVLTIAVLTIAMILGAHRGVRLRDSELLGGRGAVAIVGLVSMVVILTLAVAFGLRAIGSVAPATIGTIVGALALVVGGLRLTRYLRQVMLSNRAGTEPGTRAPGNPTPGNGR